MTVMLLGVGEPGFNDKTLACRLGFFADGRTNGQDRFVTLVQEDVGVLVLRKNPILIGNAGNHE